MGAKDGGGRARVAVISLHTSPAEQPGGGDSGGMNVYVREVTERLTRQGVLVDIFTRKQGGGTAPVERLAGGARLIQVPAGPDGPVPKERLPEVLPEFLHGVVAYAAADPADPASHRHAPYDVVHSHYWLSGWVGRQAKEIWGAPLVASFHTLGKVKNGSLARGDRPEPPIRLSGEESVIRSSDRIVSPTPAEAANLVRLYGADPARIRVVPPGVDRSVFVPQPKRRARSRLRLSGARLLLFAGRLQPLKGPDVAIRTLARAVARAPASTKDLVLAVLGGPSGVDTGTQEVSQLMRLAADTGVGDRVLFFPPQPRERLADFLSAAEAVLVPSRSESFGLVALEAQACGTPVVASAVGGLRYSVRDGESGFLIEGHDPDDHASRVLDLLEHPATAARLSAGAVRHAARFSWQSTAAEIRRVYQELSGRRSA